MEVGSLQSLSEKVLVKWLCSLSLGKSVDITQLYQYILPAAHLKADLPESCEYYTDPGLTRLFLPILVQRSRLCVTFANVKEVVRYCQNREHELLPVTHLKIFDFGRHMMEMKDYSGEETLSLLVTSPAPKIHFSDCLGGLGNLNVLVISRVEVDDNFLDALGTNCPHLTIFHARHAKLDSATDIGLESLHQCKKLKRIYLPFVEYCSCSDFDDCLHTSSHFSRKSTAKLLLLPELEMLSCLPQLLEQSLLHLFRHHKANKSQQILSLEWLNLDKRDSEGEAFVNVIQILPILCPQLKVLKVRVNSRNAEAFGNSIKSLLNLKALVISAPWNIQFASYGSQLVYLNISLRKMNEKDFIYLSQSCSQLKTLVFNNWYHECEILKIDLIKEPLFPTVEELEFLGYICAPVFKFLNVTMENLKKVNLLGAKIVDLPTTLKMIVKLGGWKKLEELYLKVDLEDDDELPLNVELVVNSFTSLCHLFLFINNKSEIFRLTEETACKVKFLSETQYYSLLYYSSDIFSEANWNTFAKYF